MKKTILKTFLFTFLMFFSYVSFSQVENGDYAKYDANTTTPTNVDYVTINTTNGYYVKPDAYYHPGYDSTGGWVLTADFTWNWSISTNPDTATIDTETDNYVEITYLATGDYVVSVAEQAPPSFGGCADGTPTIMDVTVLPVPTASIVGANVGGLNVVTANYNYYACGNQASEDLTVTITETGVPDSLSSYAYAVQKRVVNIVNIDNLDVETGTATSSYLVDYQTTSKNNIGTADGGTETIPTGALDVLNNSRTKYEFTLLQPSNLSTTEGIVSAVSHKSDYINGTIRTYPFTGTVTVVYIVNPAPQPEEIYHIPSLNYI